MIRRKESQMRKMKKWIMRIARSNLGGVLACFAIDKCIGLLPVVIKEKTKNMIMFSHPVPSYTIHELIVPRKRKKDIAELLQDEVCWNELNKVIERYAMNKELLLACNYGNRQDVQQIHFHVYLDPDFQLIENSEKLQSYMIGNTKCLFDQDANFYIEKERMTDLIYMRALLQLAKGKFTEGFTLIFYGG